MALLVTTGNVMTMEELANVKGRGWEDIDVRSLLLFILANYRFADVSSSTQH